MEHTYVPALPDPRTFGSAVPPLLDLTGFGPADNEDRAAVAAVAAEPGAVALWRSWRLSPASAPERVYVVETRGAPPAFEAEVYAPGEALPASTRAARNAGALLWTAHPVRPIRVARVFDSGGGFAAGHPRLGAGERERVAGYLEAGAAVLGTEGRLPDVVEPGRGEVVPMSYRTDGQWLWTESVGYYLRAYGLAPEPDLLAHVLAAGERPVVDAAGEHRALAVLFGSHALVAQ
ncbi:hypothetical protein [Paractinoplanes brasiliensis]|uniref:hypothetical protein n=1 Tax=Paractinoplanes brasiliensis TaxID=52695 RepID=UPI00105B8DC2|nr:hypothetical protein [Actinoplanes brasiliensis]GID28816.1 hypothetical protein Abr02nite_37990 [Actinoplanes brasiliensis]